MVNIVLKIRTMALRLALVRLGARSSGCSASLTCPLARTNIAVTNGFSDEDHWLSLLAERSVLHTWTHEGSCYLPFSES